MAVRMMGLTMPEELCSLRVRKKPMVGCAASQDNAFQLLNWQREIIFLCT